MKNENNITYSKYYIFRHLGTEQDPEYRTRTGDWAYAFDHAMLCGDYEMMLERAQQLKEMCKEYFICLGKVHVVIDPFFPIEVVNV